jgi:hypothetical protein
MESGQSAPFAINFIPSYNLVAASSGGGSVSLSPPNGPYLSNTVVTVTATPAKGWSLLEWLGDATGTSTQQTITMSRDKVAQALFGTTLSTTAAGGGSVSVYPTGGLYPYGSSVRLAAQPQAGNYFVIWGNAASGNSNPLYFTINNPTQTISSLFGALNSNQVSLTVFPTGFGQVSATPRANAYQAGTSVKLAAVPDSNQSFLGWAGDASGTDNPLTLSMTTNKTVAAQFTKFPSLIASAGLTGLTPDGFRFLLSGESVAIYQVFSSTDLFVWTTLGILTNQFGTIQFTDSAATNLLFRFYRAVEQP